ncbi:MAG: phage tail protein [Lachnospiraceae bacterium]|nr:phage tail protein [Lachnospiraceae bacterium]
MAKVGNWGKTIRFEVSSRKVLTFRNFKRSVSGRWQQHQIIGKKPKSEFTGPDASQVTMDVILSAEHGVKPGNMIKILETACEKGQVEYLYIGGKKIGRNKFYLESVSEAWDEVWNKGELVKAALSLKFTEYT